MEIIGTCHIKNGADVCTCHLEQKCRDLPGLIADVTGDITGIQLNNKCSDYCKGLGFADGSCSQSQVGFLQLNVSPAVLWSASKSMSTEFDHQIKATADYHIIWNVL